MPPESKRRITAEDLYRFQLVTGSEISPDGKQVVFALQRVDQKTEKKYANLWVVPTSGGEPRQFTYGDHVDSQPRWSPDSQKIAFLSNRGDEKQPQIYVIPFSGGEASQLTELKGEFASFRWSPDGKQFACQFRKKDADVLEREADEQKKKLGEVDRRITRTFFKLDGTGYLPQGTLAYLDGRCRNRPGQPADKPPRVRRNRPGLVPGQPRNRLLLEPGSRSGPGVRPDRAVRLGHRLCC